MKLPLLSILLPLLALTGMTTVQAQSKAQAPAADASDGKDRVQYALILPEEKTAEMVKAEENNPFESAADGAKKDEGTSEENQVRDILLRLPAVGGASGPSGMRIMLGGMRLVPGALVPPVLPDQQVSLRVRNITPSGIELVWVEKRPSGLPPKVLLIPLDGAAKVRYRLPNNGGTGSTGGGTVGTMGAIRRNGTPVLMPPPEGAMPTQQIMAARSEEQVKRAMPLVMAPPPAPKSEPPPAPKLDLFPELMSQPKVAKKTAEPKPEPKIQAPAEPKIEVRVAEIPNRKVESKVAAKEQPKTESRVATKEEPKVELKVAAKEDAKVDAKGAANEEPKGEAKVAAKEEPKSEAKVAVKDQSKAAAPKVAARKSESGKPAPKLAAKLAPEPEGIAASSAKSSAKAETSSGSTAAEVAPAEASVIRMLFGNHAPPAPALSPTPKAK